jgi:hypothetical protein
MTPQARIPACLFALTWMTGLAEPAHAYIYHAWCTGGGGWSGALSCGYDSLQQCRANARTCMQNPAPPPTQGDGESQFPGSRRR